MAHIGTNILTINPIPEIISSMTVIFDKERVFILLKDLVSIFGFVTLILELKRAVITAL